MPRLLCLLFCQFVALAFGCRAEAQWSQQGPKLVGTGGSGSSVALSLDGSTALIGGPLDQAVGAVWVFTRNNGVWSQQGSKLIGKAVPGLPGSDPAPNSRFGYSVALPGDGNSALVGAPDDNENHGSVFGFGRKNGVWSETYLQEFDSPELPDGFPYHAGNSVALSLDGKTVAIGTEAQSPSVPPSGLAVGAAYVTPSTGEGELVGTGFVGSDPIATPRAYTPVAVSADGTTVIVGMDQDNSNEGAAWVFTRSGDSWTQQGSKLVGSGAVGAAHQGASVALSVDGYTAVIGGPGDHNSHGAVWVFTREGDTWSQQGGKLVGADSVGPAYQGSAVSMAASGDLIVVGGPYDNGKLGATWTFTRHGNVWTQAGPKLVGSGAADPANQGSSVALSPDATTLLVGGRGDNSLQGAAWVFTAVAPNAKNALAPMYGSWNCGIGAGTLRIKTSGVADFRVTSVDVFARQSAWRIQPDAVNPGRFVLSDGAGNVVSKPSRIYPSGGSRFIVDFLMLDSDARWYLDLTQTLNGTSVVRTLHLEQPGPPGRPSIGIDCH